MGILKTITDEYFGDTIREEDEIDLTGLDVEIVSFTDNNGNIHRRGYKPKDEDNLKELLKRMIEKRGDEGDFNDIDTSDIKDMSSLFEANEYMNTKFDQYCKKFNGDITGWDVSNVTDMCYMFLNAVSFNQPIGNWNVSKVNYMQGMFCEATSFNQTIDKWDVSNVEDMYNMFYNATSFNQPIGKWNVSKVTDMCGMFYYAESFNQPIGDWNISSVGNMQYMFHNATSFNQDLSKWDLNGKKTINMFYDCPIKDEYKPKM